jgi:hypothetical protein
VASTSVVPSKEIAGVEHSGVSHVSAARRAAFSACVLEMAVGRSGTSARRSGGNPYATCGVSASSSMSLPERNASALTVVAIIASSAAETSLVTRHPKPRPKSTATGSR